MTTEHLVCAVELHADEERRGPGRLRGVLLRFGETTRDSRRQSFAAGSLEWDPSGVVLNEQHNRQAPITRVQPLVDGDRVLLDVPLPDTMRGRDAAVMVRNGTLTGLSAEVAVSADRVINGQREITAAELVAVGLVDRAAFAGSTVEVHERQRARRRVWL